MRLAIDQVPASELRPHPRNSNEGDVGDLIQSIKAHDLFLPIGAQCSTRFIIYGKTRWQAASIVRDYILRGDSFWTRWSQRRSETMETLPVIWYDVDDEEALRMMLVENRGRDRASYNKPGLADVLMDLDQCTKTRLFGTGFDQSDLDRLVAGLGQPFMARL